MAEVIKDKNYISVVKIKIDEIAKIDFAICKEPRETISNFYKRQTVKPDFIINGGFFSLSGGETIFNAIDEFKKISSNDLYKWGIGTLDDTTLCYGSVDTIKFKDFISGYPVLLDRGIIQDASYASEIAGRNPRSAIGFNYEYIFLVTVDGRRVLKPGMTLKQLAEYMKEIGCSYAINLDGGGSTRLHNANNEPINDPIENRAVDNVIAVYLKKEKQDESVMELTRAGIISNTEYWNKKVSEENEDAKELKSLLDKVVSTLKTVQKDGLYRVQVGAYSKKENAENMLKSLKEKGFNGYIK